MTKDTLPEWMARLAGGAVPEGTDARRAFDLHQPDSLWVVVRGRVDLFHARSRDGQPFGERQFVATIPAGHALFGVKLPAPLSERGLFGVGDPDTVLLRVEKARFTEWLEKESDPAHGISLLETWVTALTRSIWTTGTPARFLDIPVGVAFTVERDACVRPHQGLLWFRHLSGASRYLGVSNLHVSTVDPFIPLVRTTWLQVCEEKATLVAIPSREHLERPGAVWESLDALAGMVMESLGLQVLEKREWESQAASLRGQHDARLVRDALLSLEEALVPSELPPTGRSDEDPLLAVMRLVTEAKGIRLRKGVCVPSGARPAQVDAVARAARVRMRQVRLDHGWWRVDNGSLVGFWSADGRPVALLPDGPRRYVLADPSTGRRCRVDESVARGLAPRVFVAYRSLPDRALALADLARFTLRGAWRDLVTVGALGLGSALLALALPMATGWLVGTVVPAGSASGLSLIAAGMLAAAMANFAYQVIGAFVLLRLETRAEAEVQAAVWDRLLALPVWFFRRYTVGDLGSRAAGIGEIRRLASGQAVTLLVHVLFSGCSLSLCLVYSVPLAATAILLSGVSAAVTIVVCWMSLRFQRRIAEIGGRLSGLVLQLITGLPKLRVAGAEVRAFASWARLLARQQALAVRLGSLDAAFGVFRPVFASLCSVVVFAVTWSCLQPAAEGGGSRIAPGDFVAFAAAFGQALGSLTQLGGSLVRLLQVGPIYDRVSCIFEAEPEVREGKLDPGELRGGLDVTAVSFRYHRDGPSALRHVSLAIRPGEFIGIVGPSGGGKSTLLRVLLGFERPDAGCVRYDGKDLADLDVALLRRQFGVVLQNGRVMSGDIYSNVAGTSDVKMEDAWEALRLAGLEDEIRSLPMGMHTIITEGGNTFSGGQRQRLLIARAIALKPKILFLDEATSALDNRTQSAVMTSLDRLDVTRIVIAHRLSTIRNADRIYVFADGQIEEQGTYEQLMDSRGMFAALAGRQTL